jgi:uncharacterized repeat protein (TIGR03943 family)
LSPSSRERVGLALIAIAVVCTIWLAVAGKLTLYIHPRYLVFTVLMALVALLLTIATIAAPKQPDPARRRRVGLASIAAVVVAATVSAGMLLLPPATLTTATADQRELNSTTIGAEAQSLESASAQSGAAFARFTVVDWSSLLRQTSDPAFFSGKSVDVVGFITRSDDDPQNLYYLSRFIITCCAVDAQPVGVAVYQPGWGAALAEGDWVHVTGEFAASPSTAGGPSIVLRPDATESVEEPSEPYLY